MANVQRGKSGSGRYPMAIASATVLAIGDLVFRDPSTGKAKPVSDQTDAGTELLNQRLVAEHFAGVSEHQSLSGQTADVLIDASPTREFLFACASETHEVGDLLGIDEDAGADGLEPQTLVKVTAPSQAVMVCTRRDASAATSVYCRIYRSVFWGTGLAQQQGVDLLTETAASTAVTAGTATVFSNGTKTIDGSKLKAGDMLRIHAAGIIGTTTGNETAVVAILVGTEVVGSTSTLDVTDADVFVLNLNVVVRVAGASGKLLASGSQSIGPPASATLKPLCSSELSEDISSTALTVTCRITHSSTGESSILHTFTLEIIRA